jgi:hypothetical protein
MDGLADHPSTMNDYRKIINLLHTYDNGRLHITSMTKQDAEDYFSMLEKRADDGEMSTNTVHRYEATLRSIGRRMQAHPETFPDYQNPFSGILHDEVRSKTTYTKETFADPADIRKIIRVLPEFSHERRILLELMLFVGLRPKHIEKLTFADFTPNPKHPKTELILSFDEGTFTEKKDSRNAELREDKNAKLINHTASGNMTWQVTGRWCFFENYTSVLRKYHPALGSIRDDRPYFMTSRHQPYTYRAQHHLVQEACRKAGLSPGAVTPYQLSLYGSVSSYLIMDTLMKHEELKNSLAYARFLDEKNRILAEMRNAEMVFLPLAQNGWIGEWVDDIYPANRRERIDEITSQLGSDALYKIVGVEKP